MIAAHNILPNKVKPKAFAEFFVNLPESLEHQKVSLSISNDQLTFKGAFEDFFHHLWTRKYRFAFKTLQINFDNQSTKSESILSCESFSYFLTSKELHVRNVEILGFGKGL